MFCEGFISSPNFQRVTVFFLNLRQRTIGTAYQREGFSFPEMDSTAPAWRDLVDAVHRLESEMTNIEELKQRANRAVPRFTGEDGLGRMPQSSRRLRLRLEEQEAEVAEVGASHPIPTHRQPMRRR
jgi:hypothetical protein